MCSLQNMLYSPTYTFTGPPLGLHCCLCLCRCVVLHVTRSHNENVTCIHDITPRDARRKQKYIFLLRKMPKIITHLGPVKMNGCTAGVSVLHSNQVLFTGVQRFDSTIACNFTLLTVVWIGNGYICIWQMSFQVGWTTNIWKCFPLLKHQHKVRLDKHWLYLVFWNLKT